MRRQRPSTGIDNGVRPSELGRCVSKPIVVLPVPEAIVLQAALLAPRIHD